MKYRIDWFDTSVGKSRVITVHTAKAASEVMNTLHESRHAEHIAVTHIKPGRLREYVITIER